MLYWYSSLQYMQRYYSSIKYCMLKLIAICTWCILMLCTGSWEECFCRSHYWIDVLKIGAMYLYWASIACSQTIYKVYFNNLWKLIHNSKNKFCFSLLSLFLYLSPLTLSSSFFTLLAITILFSLSFLSLLMSSYSLVFMTTDIVY